MTIKTGTPDELAKVWGELDAHGLLLYDICRNLVQESGDADQVSRMKERSYESIQSLKFPDEHEDTRSPAKASLDRFWSDFEDALKRMAQ